MKKKIFSRHERELVRELRTVFAIARFQRAESERAPRNDYKRIAESLSEKSKAPSRLRGSDGFETSASAFTMERD